MAQRVERSFIASLLIGFLSVSGFGAELPPRVARNDTAGSSNTVEATRGSKRLKVEWSAIPGYGPSRSWNCDQTEIHYSYSSDSWITDFYDDESSTLLDTFSASASPVVYPVSCNQNSPGGSPDPASSGTELIDVSALTVRAAVTVRVDQSHTFFNRSITSTTPNSGCYSGGGPWSVGYLDVDITALDRCEPTTADPIVTARKTDRNHATVLVEYEFPEDAEDRALTVRVLPKHDATGTTSAESIVAVWEGSDAALANNGPFVASEVELPTEDRQVAFHAEASYYLPDTECEGLQRGFGAIDADCCSSAVGDPVSVVDGNTRLTDVDPLPPLFDRQLTRTFNSGHGRNGFFGVGWSTIFDQVLNIMTVDSAPVLIHFVTAENETVAFEDDGVQIWPAGITVPGTLVYDNLLGAYVYRPPGSRYETRFDGNDGFFAGMRDVSTGRTFEVVRHYDVTGPLSSMDVTDSWSGMTWTMTVDDDLVQEISTSSGQTWTYDYDSNGLLEQVDGPDGLWRTYTYNSGGISEARDAVGNLIESHSYDSDGKGTSSSGPADEIATIEYDFPGPNSDESMTRITTLGGGVTELIIKPVGGAHRVIQREGGCPSCGTRHESVVYDQRGRTIRRQEADGYITTNSYTGNYLTSSTANLKPATCDPRTDTNACQLDSDDLATVSLATTSSTVTTTWAYEDANWPDKQTTITVTSVRNPSSTRTETYTYDSTSGSELTKSITGWTGYPTATEETRTWTNTLYDGLEGAAFDPGGSFPTTLAQPRLVKQMDGPRTDVDDVIDFVYYPIDASVSAELRGRVAATRNAAGHITRFENYDWFGNPRRIIDPNDVQTETTTDSIGRTLTSTVVGLTTCNTTIDPLCDDDLTLSFLYDDHGPLLRETRAGGGVTTYSYDARGRVDGVSRGPSASDLREKIETTWGSDSGKKELVRNFAKVGTSWVEKYREEYAYDGESRLTTVTHADSSTIEYTYDVAGRLDTVQDENHASANTTYAYGPAGRLETTTQALSGAPGGVIETSYEYDAHGNLSKVTDPNGNETEYVYDDFGQLLRQDSAVTGVTSYQYDQAGNLISTVDANGAMTTRIYDELNRVLTSESEIGTETESVSWTYDSGTLGIGRLSEMNDPSGSTSYTYDRRGLLLVEDQTVDSVQYVRWYQYDEDGNRSQVGYPSGHTVDYLFDYAGRPSSATMGSTTIIASADYLPFGPLGSLEYGNATTSTMTFNSRYQLTENKLDSPSMALSEHDFAYDDAGNITNITDALDSGYDRTYEYDDLRRLITANTGGSLWETGGFTYDAMGNVLSATYGVDTQTFTYSGTTPKMSGVSYDDAGNETDTQTISPRNYVSRSSFNFSCMTCDASFQYDGRGIRTATFVQSAPLAPTRAHHHLYLPELTPLARFDYASSLSLTTPSIIEFIWFNGRPVAEVDTYGTSSDVFYTHTDHLGSPILQTDAAGDLFWRAEYQPYGQAIIRDGPVSLSGTFPQQPLRFPGQEATPSDTYNIFRWYRAGWGRYTQADPIGFESGDTNWYAYAGGNSVSFADPLGLAIMNPMDIYRDFRDRRAQAQNEFRGQSEMRHCVFSCRMAREYGSWLTRNAGFVNEAQGFFMHDLRMLGSRLRGDTPWAFQPDDLINNERGFACADRIEANPKCTTCETCCRESISRPRPRPTPPPVFPTSFGPCAKVNGQTVCAGTGI